MIYVRLRIWRYDAINNKESVALRVDNIPDVVLYSTRPDTPDTPDASHTVIWIGVKKEN